MKLDGINEKNLNLITAHKKIVIDKETSVFAINVNHSVPDSVMYVLNTIPINLYIGFWYSALWSNTDILFFTKSIAVFVVSSCCSSCNIGVSNGFLPNSFSYIVLKSSFGVSS